MKLFLRFGYYLWTALAVLSIWPSIDYQWIHPDPFLALKWEFNFVSALLFATWCQEDWKRDAINRLTQILQMSASVRAKPEASSGQCNHSQGSDKQPSCRQ